MTGQLSPFEQDFLITSYNRAQAGGYQTTQLVAQSPEGPRGLLRTYRNELAGQSAPQAPAPIVAVAPTPQVVAPVVPAPVVVPTPVPQPQPVVREAAVSSGTALPNFFQSGAPEASLASHCNTVSLLTSTNGYTTAASMTDPTAALNEQFCLARTYAIARSEELISQVGGFTPQQVAQQVVFCQCFPLPNKRFDLRVGPQNISKCLGSRSLSLHFPKNGPSQSR